MSPQRPTTDTARPFALHYLACGLSWPCAGALGHPELVCEVDVKRLAILLLTSLPLPAQVPGKITEIPFDRADPQHCRVVMIEGRPMLQTTYDGTSVAVGLPASSGDEDFRVFVVVQQSGPGRVQVKPREFFALYSDPAHTRFGFYDKAAEVEKRRVGQQTQESGQQVQDSAVVAASSEGDSEMQGVPSTPGAEADINRQATAQRLKNEDPNGPTRDQEAAREENQCKALPGSAVTPDELYLRPSTLRQGTSSQGFVYFRKPKGSNLHIGPRDLLFEIDIPVNGVVFRFS
jgi:hypothetical protein